MKTGGPNWPENIKTGAKASVTVETLMYCVCSCSCSCYYIVLRSMLCVGVLDEEDGDVLINVNMLDNEKANVNVENKLKKPTYKPYDEDEFEGDGLVCTEEPCYNVLRSSFGQGQINIKKIDHILITRWL